MGQAMGKTTKNLIEWLTFAYLILFPFGQIIRWDFDLGSLLVPVHPADIVAGVFLLVFLFGKVHKPPFFRHVENFLLAALFSLGLSAIFFQSRVALLGGLYLVRLAAYSALFVGVNSIAKTPRTKKKLFNSLLAICFAVGLFSWFQYFVYPDVRALKIWGWDDHLYRMIGSFLDPTFTSIILVFGFILSLVSFLTRKSREMLALTVFFLVSVAFTYARAGYIALLAGTAVALFLQKKIRALIVIITAFVIVVALLPQGPGEGVNLQRTYSIFSRFTNYRETIDIFSTSPVFGIGYNNLCLARSRLLGELNPLSHSCSGSDSSLLLVLATTGVVGLLTFLKMISAMFKSISTGVYAKSFTACAIAVGLHGFFANSYFYPWVMGFMGILLALALKREVNS
jgi:hypothetical protein